MQNRSATVSYRRIFPTFLGPAVLNALGLAAFNYDFRDDREDRGEFAASLRDFMCVRASNSLVGSMMSWFSGPKGLDSRRIGKCSAKVSWFTSPHGFWIQ